MKKLLVVAAVFALLVSARAADYGKITKFEKGKAVAFPDCEVVFAGERKVSSAVYPRGFTYYDFKVTSGGKSKDVSWSAGTGEIAPITFEVSGKKFVLELKHSDAFKGWLKPDEMVLWKDRIVKK